MTAQRDELRWRVWSESWNQSRHLETMRSQYLGFFFTAALAVAAFAAPDIAKGSLRTSASLAILAVLVFGLDLLAAFLLLAVTRIGDVLDHFQRVQDRIQAEVIGEQKRPGWLERPVRRRGLRSTQRASAGVLTLAAAGFPLILAAVTVRGFTVDAIPVGTRVIVTAAFVLTAGASIASLVACRSRA